MDITSVAAKARAAARGKAVPSGKRRIPAPKPPPPPSPEQRLQWALQHMQQQAWQEAVHSLGNLDEAKTVTPALARLWFVRATLALQLCDSDAALHYFLKVWHTYPLLADYAAWEIVQYHASRAALPALQEMVSQLRERYAFSRFVSPSQLLLARLQYRFGEVEQARATLEQLRQAPGQPSSVRRATLELLSQLYDDAGDTATATQLRQTLEETSAREGRDLAILERKGYAPFKDMPRKPLRLTPEQMLASLDRLADANLWPELETRLETLSKIVTPESFVIQIGLKRAMFALWRQRLDEAAAVLRTLLERYPYGSHQATAHVLLASVYERQNRPEESSYHYEQATAQVASAVWTAKALWDLTTVPANGISPTPPREYMPRRNGTTPEAEAWWEAGWALYGQKNYAAAELVWGSFERYFPRSLLLSKILYWRARVAQHTQHLALAIRLYQRLLDDYPVHYYSVQARAQLQALEVPVAATPEPWLPVVPFDTFSLPPEAKKAAQPRREHFHYSRIRELQLLQMFEAAAEEVRALSACLSSTAAAQYFVAVLLAESQQPVEAFQLVSGFTNGLGPEEIRGLPPTFWALLYPRAYWTEVSQHARTFKIDAYLVLSVMRQESAFNPTAISSAGARGLMQMMPATAEELVSPLRLPGFTLDHLYEPTVNIALGTQYLASLLQRYQGNLVFALAAYNAGIGRVTRWREQWPDLPMDEFIESIPIEETRFYVKYVLRNLMLYERLYKS